MYAGIYRYMQVYVDGCRYTSMYVVFDVVIYIKRAKRLCLALFGFVYSVLMRFVII